MPREVRMERLRGWVMGVWVGMAALGGTAWGREPANAVGVGVGVLPLSFHLFYEGQLSSHWSLRIAFVTYPVCTCPGDVTYCYFFPTLMIYSFRVVGSLYVDAGAGILWGYMDGPFVFPSLGGNLRVVLSPKVNFLTGFYFLPPVWHFTWGWRF
jgi:hypothetical protein